MKIFNLNFKKLKFKNYFAIFTKVFFVASIGFLTALFAYGVISYAILAPQIMEADFSSSMPVSSKIVDRNGKLLYEIGGPIKRTPIESSEIPEMVKNAHMSAEDEDFYKHIGIDPKAIGRAFIANIKSGDVEQGGSTITQQLVKNTFLTSEQTLQRKVKEAVLAMALERRMTKDEIMNAYLNNTPYGGNIVGVLEASKNFFHKEPKDLTLSEAATLAALPKSPTYLSPYNGNKDKLVQRRNSILKTMLDEGYVNQEEYKTAVAAELNAYPLVNQIAAPHFTLMVRDELIAKYGREKVEQSGWIIKTSLDLELQQETENIVRQHTPRINGWGANNAGAVVADPNTGEILAMVGSLDFYNQNIKGEVNTTISMQQPGSSFKPIVYATLFAEGPYSPASVLYDLPTSFNGYQPRNYNGSFKGPMTIREALAGSLNIPAVKAQHIAGIDATINTAEKMGIYSLQDRDRYGLSLALGGGEVKLTEMVNAFGTFANQGKNAPLTTILSIETFNGQKVFESKTETSQAIPAEVAFQISHILSDNGARSYVFGPNSSLAFPGHRVAAKTGTTDEYKDAWTLGYTKQRVVGVWVGNTDNSPMRPGAAGTFVAAPLWRALMLNSMNGLAYEDFSPPSTLQLARINTVKGVKVDYVAPWQTGGSTQFAGSAADPSWQGSVAAYWQRKQEEEAKRQQEEQQKQQQEQTEQQQEDQPPATDVGGATEQDTSIQSTEPEPTNEEPAENTQESAPAAEPVNDTEDTSPPEQDTNSTSTAPEA